MGERWTDRQLDSFRMQGDPEVDELVASILPQSGQGVAGYNHTLLLIDQLMKNPELVLVRNSNLARSLQQVPEALLDYFDPLPAPDWLDAEKLKLGSRVWRNNTLATLAVLYSASLPSCYLMKRGIPALYRSDKLREHRYIFQRIYETGRMLEAVMDPGGIQILEDQPFDEDELLRQALHNLDPRGRWEHSGRQCQRTAESTTPIDARQVSAEVARLRKGGSRYLWGKGYLSAKKVRFLHGAMRFMLVQPDQRHPLTGDERPLTLTEALALDDSPWDFETFGYPVNQEDLAYTLLTFGLVIPRGLARWGVTVDEAERDGFLHLWKVVGHVMGIDARLLTDQWQEAETLFSRIQARQAGHSSAGMALTEALMGFLGEYLPRIPGMAEQLSVAMIHSQLGSEQTRMIVPEKLYKETFRFWRRPVYTLARVLTRLGFRLKSIYLKGFRHLGGITVNRVHQAGEHLIESWRSAYIRRPFFVPVNATTWIRQPGADGTYIDELVHWRRRLLANLGLAMALLLITGLSLPSALLLGLLSGHVPALTALGLAGSSWLAALGLLHWRLQRVFDQRPVPTTEVPGAR